MGGEQNSQLKKYKKNSIKVAKHLTIKNQMHLQTVTYRTQMKIETVLKQALRMQQEQTKMQLETSGQPKKIYTANTKVQMKMKKADIIS